MPNLDTGGGYIKYVPPTPSAAPTPAPTASGGGSPNPTYTADSGNPMSGFGYNAVGSSPVPMGDIQGVINGTYQGNYQAPEPTPTPKFTMPTLPDWNTYLQDALSKLGIGNLDSNLKSLQEKAIINFGDPALAQMAGFGLDPQAADFARQNYLSGNASLARIDKGHDLAKKAIINKLVSSGLLRSGDLGYMTGQEDQNYSNTQYDARQQVLNQLQQYMQDYLDRKNALNQNVWQAYQSAYNNFLSNPGQYLGINGG